jgi:hypothetical protein
LTSSSCQEACGQHGNYGFALPAHPGGPQGRLRTVYRDQLSSYRDQLLESELLGHAKGAFTAMIKRVAAKIEHTDGRTLFPDQIGDTPHAIQVRLLRFKEPHMIDRNECERRKGAGR